MTGKSENIVSYSAEQVEAMRGRGEGKTDWNMSHEEAMRRRHADPEAPRPYSVWEDTITAGLPEAKEQKLLSDGMQHQAFQIGLESLRVHSPQLAAGSFICTG